MTDDSGTTRCLDCDTPLVRVPGFAAYASLCPKCEPTPEAEPLPDVMGVATEAWHNATDADERAFKAQGGGSLGVKAGALAAAEVIVTAIQQERDRAVRERDEYWKRLVAEKLHADMNDILHRTTGDGRTTKAPGEDSDG